LRSDNGVPVIGYLNSELKRAFTVVSERIATRIVFHNRQLAMNVSTERLLRRGVPQA
jgi:hypothetical protein